MKYPLHQTKKLTILLTAGVMALSVLPAGLPVTASAAATSAPGTSSVSALTARLSQDQAKLAKLNDEVERAGAALDGLDRQLTQDRQRQAGLDGQLQAVARLDYEQPGLTLSTLLAARSLDQLLSDFAQARLVSRRQASLLDSARALQKQDRRDRDQQAAQLAAVTAARDEAQQVASRAGAMLASAQDAALKAQAQRVAMQASAAAPRPAAWTGGGRWPNHFSYGYCTWYVANKRYVPWYGNAIEWWPNARSYGYAEGQTPKVGAIMVTRESGYGHVAYVESVNGDGSWTVSEMNYTGWDQVDTRTIRPGQVPLVGFIY